METDSAKKEVSFVLNGKTITVEVSPKLTLLRLLRDHLRMTGTKCGCNQGECGTCTVIMDGRATRSCLIQAHRLQGKRVETIEGLSPTEELHPVQTAFIEAGAIQCGFCTPGMLMAAKALLDKNPDPAEKEIKDALSPNLCRCTGYASIIQAVSKAAAALKETHGKTKQKEHRHAESRIGSSPQDKDSIEKATGTLQFADDMYIDDMLYGKILLSPVPHAEIVSIDTGEAEKTPGVAAVLTAKDVPGRNGFGRMIPHQPVLADKRVRFVGDAIAVVFAETEDIARQAKEKIKVEYQELKGVFSPLEALKADAPMLHEGGNILREFTNKKGSIQDGFAHADIIVEDTYYTPFLEHGFLEPESGVASIDADGLITIWYPTQAPFHSKKQVAASLDYPEDKIRVAGTPLGGGFGGKTDITIEILLALGTLYTKRPVKITLERLESMRMDTKRHPFYMRYKTGARKDGKLTALKARFVLDVGAYAGISPGVLEQAVIFSGGPYVWQNLLVEGSAVYTNNLLGGAFRGFGINQVHFALESQMDRMARDLGMDPFEFRLKNALAVGAETSTGEVLKASVGIKETIRQTKTALARMRYKPPAGKKIGIGVASGYKNVGYGRGYNEHGGTIIQLLDTGEVWVRSSAVDMGQGVRTLLAQIAAENIGIDYEIIKMTTGDTALVPDGVAAVGQRQTFITGNATIGASKIFKQKILEIVARELGLDSSGLDLQGRAVVNKESRDEIVTLKSMAERMSKRKEPIVSEYNYVVAKTHPLRGDTQPTYRLYQQNSGRDEIQEYDPERYHNYMSYSYVTQVAVVEVDPDDGSVLVRKIIAAHDVGKALNPQRIQGQIEGSLLMGVGYALSEEFIIQKGINLTKSLRKCGISDVWKTPEMEIIIVEDPEPEGPYGAKGASEVALVPTAPAITNAIYDAVGVRITSLPATPDKILDGLRHQTRF